VRFLGGSLLLSCVLGAVGCGSNSGSGNTPMSPTSPTQPAVAVATPTCPGVVQKGVASWSGTPWYQCSTTVSNATNTAVTWSSGQTGLLTVDSSTGALTPLARGKATITATSVADPTKSASVTVDVVDRVLAGKFEPLAWLPGQSGSLLWFFETDGSNAERLLNTRECWFPAMSPDHRHVACMTYPLPTETYNGTELIVVTTDGTPTGTTASSPLTNIRGVEYPAWSPDGKKVAFVGWQNDPATPGNTSVGVFTINADGTGLVQLTSESFAGNTIRIPGSASFSPDGKSIAYGVDADDYIRIMNSDGSNIVVLPMEGYNPAFTLDGKKILFLNATLSEIESMNLGGSNPVAVINYPESFYIAISPDGSEIAYEEGLGTIASTIYIADIDRSSPTLVSGSTGAYGLGW